MNGYQKADPDWLNHLSQTYPVPRETLERLWEEFLVRSDVSLEDFVAARHLELQASGMKNPAIYLQVQKEIRGRRFKAPECSLRQIRRMIYG